MMASRMKIGAAWKGETRNGKEYLKIRLDGPLFVPDPDTWEVMAWSSDSDRQGAPDFELTLQKRQQQQDREPRGDERQDAPRRSSRSYDDDEGNDPFGR
jgi:hypothetical protein